MAPSTLYAPSTPTQKNSRSAYPLRTPSSQSSRIRVSTPWAPGPAPRRSRTPPQQMPRSSTFPYALRQPALPTRGLISRNVGANRVVLTGSEFISGLAIRPRVYDLGSGNGDLGMFNAQYEDQEDGDFAARAPSYTPTRSSFSCVPSTQAQPQSLFAMGNSNNNIAQTGNEYHLSFGSYMDLALPAGNTSPALNLEDTQSSRYTQQIITNDQNLSTQAPSQSVFGTIGDDSIVQPGNGYLLPSDPSMMFALPIRNFLPPLVIETIKPLRNTQRTIPNNQKPADEPRFLLPTWEGLPESEESARLAEGKEDVTTVSQARVTVKSEEEKTEDEEVLEIMRQVDLLVGAGSATGSGTAKTFDEMKGTPQGWGPDTEEEASA